jgi:hypothetical protein
MAAIEDGVCKGLRSGLCHSGCHSNPFWFHCGLTTENLPLLKGFGTTSKSLYYGAICPGEAVSSDEPSEGETDPKDRTPRSPSFDGSLEDPQDSAEAPLLNGRSEHNQGMVSEQNYRRFHDWSISHADCRSEDARSNLGDEVPGKSPYLEGVSIGRFWLIYGGILVNLVL